jgi:quinol-cytochrome oxidoreductase complex cytochrome b subunit
MKFSKKLDDLKQTQLWKSISRRGYTDSPKNRAQAVLVNIFMHLHPVKLPRGACEFRFTWGMGGISFFLFLLLTITGVLLMYYYTPSIRDAYWDMKDLEFTVPFGLLLRNLHRWAAHLMVITVWLHMFRVFMTGSYKPPREFNWAVGVVLLVTTLLLSFTGYLLPWDQLGFWAITVGTNMARATPLVGHEGPLGEQLGMTPYTDIRFALLGGSIVGQSALLRAYVWHCIALPLVAAVFMAVHFWRVRRDGGISYKAISER